MCYTYRVSPGVCSCWYLKTYSTWILSPLDSGVTPKKSWSTFRCPASAPSFCLRTISSSLIAGACSKVAVATAYREEKAETAVGEYEYSSRFGWPPVPWAAIGRLDKMFRKLSAVTLGIQGMLEILNVKNFCGINGFRVDFFAARLDRIGTRMKLYNRFKETATSNVMVTSDQTTLGISIMCLIGRIYKFQDYRKCSCKREK